MEKANIAKLKPYPKLGLNAPVRLVLRYRRWGCRTEQSYSDSILDNAKFHCGNNPIEDEEKELDMEKDISAVVSPIGRLEPTGYRQTVRFWNIQKRLER